MVVFISVTVLIYFLWLQDLLVLLNLPAAPVLEPWWEKNLHRPVMLSTVTGKTLSALFHKVHFPVEISAGMKCSGLPPPRLLRLTSEHRLVIPLSCTHSLCFCSVSENSIQVNFFLSSGMNKQYDHDGLTQKPYAKWQLLTVDAGENYLQG